jgi:hypothetical protein
VDQFSPGADIPGFPGLCARFRRVTADRGPRLPFVAPRKPLFRSSSRWRFHRGSNRERASGDRPDAEFVGDSVQIAVLERLERAELVVDPPERGDRFDALCETLGLPMLTATKPLRSSVP